MVLKFIETHCPIKFSRSILPWMQDVSTNPKLLKHIFGCKEKEFKRLYGEFALNKTKSEAIIGQHNEYFNVRIQYSIHRLTSPNLSYTNDER